MTPDATNLIDLLCGSRLSALVKPGQAIVSLTHNMTVGDALRVLARHNILSAPLVLSPDIEDSGEDNLFPRLLGWLGIDDILSAFLKFLSESGKEVPMKMLALMTALEKEGPQFAKKTLITIRSAEDRQLMYFGDSDTMTVLEAIRSLFLQTDLTSGEAKVAHRVALFNAHGEITSIISQMDVARWLVTNEHHIGEDGSKTIDELGLLTGKPPVMSVSPVEPTLMAFDKMAQSNYTGAPVLADDGELIANLSVSDLRALTSEHFGVLSLPVAEFLALEHNTSYIGYAAHDGAADNKNQHHPFFGSTQRSGGNGKDLQLHTAYRTTTLLQALHIFCDNHVHRVYIVEKRDGGKLHVEAVLTLTDVLRVLAGVW